MTALVAVTAPGDQLAQLGNQEDTVKPYTDADVLDLQDVIADARIRGIGNGTYSMARAILEAGYLPTRTADHDKPYTDADIEQLTATVRAQIGWPISAGEVGTIVTAVLATLASDGRLRSTEATRD